MLFEDGTLLERAILEAEEALGASLTLDTFGQGIEGPETRQRRQMLVWLKELQYRREFEAPLRQEPLRDQGPCLCSG